MEGYEILIEGGFKMGKLGRWIGLAAAFFTALALAGCQGVGGSSEDREVEEYLADRYEGVEFQIEKTEDGDEACYRVTPVEFPEVSFSVWEGKIEESQDWNFHDDYAAQMLYGGAERRGLSYEKGSEGYNIFVNYDNYESLNLVAQKLARLVDDCVRSRAFDLLRASCRITVKPASEDSPYCPGYQIRIGTRYSFAKVKRFGVEAADLEERALARDLRLFHIYYSYHYTLQEDESAFYRQDMDQYLKDCTGAEGTADDGSITVYEPVDRGKIGLDFGGAYYILRTEGLVTEVSENSFTAAGNGLIVEFHKDFTEDGPYVSYQILEGELDSPVEDINNDTHLVVSSLTGKSISFSTPEKTAAAKEEERQNRLPIVTEAFAAAEEAGQTTQVGPLEFTIVGEEELAQLEGRYGVMESGEDSVWVRLDLRITNTGDSLIRLFPVAAVPDSDGAFVLAADREANLYRPTEVIGLGLDALYGVGLSAGETVEGIIYFDLPRQLPGEGDLVLMVFCAGEESALLFSRK